MTITAAEVSSVAAIRSFIGGRRRRPWFDWYAIGFTVVLVAVLGSDVLAEPFSRLTGSSGGSPPAQAEAGAALVAAAAAGLLVVAQTFGPLAVSPPDASWLLLSPLDRREVLRRPLAATAALAALAGGVLGVLALAMAGPYLPRAHYQLWAWLALAAIGGAGFFLAAVLTAVLAQPSRHQRGRLRATAAAVAAVAVTGGVAAGRWSALSHAVTAGFGEISYRTVCVLAAVALAAACGVALLVRRMLPQFPAGVLRAESARASTTRLAATFLNVPLLAWVAEDNRWRGRLLASRPWPQLPPAFASAWPQLSPALASAWPQLSPALALAWVDWRRLARRPASLAVLAASALAPTLVGEAITGHERGLTIAATLLAGAIAAGSQGTTALKRDANDPTLRRLLGVAAGPALAVRAALPVLLSAAWMTLALMALVIAGVLPGWLWPALGLAAGPGAATAALRIARAEPINPADRGPDTAISAPPWLVTRAISALLGVVGCYPLLKAVRAGHADGGTFIAQVLVSAVVLGGYLLIASRSSP
jgi:Family of unknown function (DUF6297)